MASSCLRSVRRFYSSGLLRFHAAGAVACNGRSGGWFQPSPSPSPSPSLSASPATSSSSSSSPFIYPSPYIRRLCAAAPSDDFQAPPKATPADAQSEEPQGKPSADAEHHERSEALDEKTQVLQAALLHVPKLGWSEAAMVAGARDVGLSPAIVGVFPRKGAALVEFFMDDCLQNLLDITESQEDEFSKMILQERITKLIKLRLEMQTPFISRWAQALSIQANPANLPTSFKQRAILMDEIWHAVGDHSSDVDWYAKRGVLAAVYTATELYMLTDYSPEFRESWSFLERRVRDALDCRKTAQEATQLAQAIGAGLGSSLQSLFRR